MFQKKYRIEKILRHISLHFLKIFQLMIKKSLTFLPLKIQNIFFINLMTLLKHTKIQGISYYIREKCLILSSLKKLKTGIITQKL